MKKTISLILITVLLLSISNVAVFANASTVNDMLKGKTITELLETKDLSLVGIYDVGGASYNAYKVNYELVKLYPYAIFTDSNNNVVRSTELVSKLYDIYYLYNVAKPGETAKAMLDYNKATELFKTYELLETYFNLVGAGGACYLSPESIGKIFTEVGKEEFLSMLSKERIAYFYFSYIFNSTRAELIGLEKHLSSSRNQTTFNYETEAKYIYSYKTSLMSSQSVVEYLENVMYEQVEDVKWYEPFKIALKSFIGNTVWQEVKVKNEDGDSLKKLNVLILSYGIASKDSQVTNTKDFKEFVENLDEILNTLSFADEYMSVYKENVKIRDNTIASFKSPALINQIKDDKIVNVKINNKLLSFNNETGYPFVRNGRTYLPIKKISESLNLIVKWDSKLDSAYISNGSKVIYVPIGNKIFQVKTTSGQKIKSLNSDAPAILVNGRTYVPVGVMLKEFGYSISWDNNTATMTIQ